MLVGLCWQAFIQALLSTAVLPKRFSFFTVFFVHWLCWVAPWYTSKEKVLKFRSADYLENAFFLDFPGVLEFLWGVLKKSGLERCIQLSFMHVCLYLNQRV